jgi:hypothetical protein
MREQAKAIIHKQIAPYISGYQTRKKAKKEPAVVSSDGLI